MNIFQTFEIFLREPFSILKDRIIQIVNVNSNYAMQPSVTVDMLERKTQITVVNSDKMYNLLQTVLHKQKANAAQKLLLPERKGQIVIGQLCKRY